MDVAREHFFALLLHLLQRQLLVGREQRRNLVVGGLENLRTSLDFVVMQRLQLALGIGQDGFDLRLLVGRQTQLMRQVRDPMPVHVVRLGRMRHGRERKARSQPGGQGRAAHRAHYKNPAQQKPRLIFQAHGATSVGTVESVSCK